MPCPYRTEHLHRIFMPTVAQYEFFDTTIDFVLWQFYKATPAVYKLTDRQLYYLSGKIIGTNWLYWWQALSWIGGLVARI